eukprot:TRINITY_DN20830_c0_g1_i1.p1 TRINITY_DN20830_c0_g1~~TRINITY_DN20830_c0_g1_i1.p1  ORF type:complete len:746 (-),score=156.45 TRINITY_DN20830_c0_g1_i1:179-2416(-)
MPSEARKMKDAGAALKSRGTRGVDSASRTSPVPKGSSTVVCYTCSTARSKLPPSWSQQDGLFYCRTCWEQYRCDRCGEHDAKGSMVQGRWSCRTCRLGGQKRSSGNKDASRDVLHRLIIQDHNGETPCTTYLSEDVIATSSGTQSEEDDEAEAAEMEDTLAPLAGKEEPQHGYGSRASSSSGLVSTKMSSQLDRQSHIVLVIDASGSMRIRDVVNEPAAKLVEHGGDMVERLDAAVACAAEFVEAHARKHPADTFSVVAFCETAEVVSELQGVAETKRALQELALHGAKGTMYRCALESAARLLALTPSHLAHIVLLSDGGPGDTRAALDYFQREYMKGASACARVHGIGFGASVQSFAALQQLCCLSSGMFTLSACSVRGLCEAFASVSSTITSTIIFVNSREASSDEPQNAAFPLCRHRTPRPVWYEPAELGVFGKKGVLRFMASCSSFRYEVRWDGDEFVLEDFGKRQVERRQYPQMRGGMRLVYSFHDEKLASGEGSWMVAKCSRFLDEALNRREVVESHAKCSAVARYYASRFNDQLRAAGALKKRAALFFVPTFTYEASEKPPDDEPVHFAAERYLPGVFLKYNSNNGYVSEDMMKHHDVVNAFTHFSYEASGRKLLVADLQGVARDNEVLMTDPQVLSLDNAYGPGDIGERGMYACLVAHRCGAACKKLGLTPLGPSDLKQLGGGREVRGGRRALSQSSAQSSGFERVGEQGLLEYALSEGIQSSHNSASSWTYLLDT